MKKVKYNIGILFETKPEKPNDQGVEFFFFFPVFSISVSSLWSKNSLILLLKQFAFFWGEWRMERTKWKIGSYI